MMSNNHPGRRKSARKPPGRLLEKARLLLGHSQTVAAQSCSRGLRTWQNYEATTSDPAVIDLYLMTNRLIEPGQTWRDWK